MSEVYLFQKKCEIYNYKQLLRSICDTDFGSSVDTEPVSNPVVYAEYVWIKPPVKIDEEEDVKKEKK
jgi:hypothetical protein